MMKRIALKQLKSVSPQSHIFIRKIDGKQAKPVIEYSSCYADYIVEKVTATAYPMYTSVLEVEIFRAKARK